MTQQARNGYRKHKKSTWGFALLLALAIGAILIPFASGGNTQTYTFTGDAGACAGTTSVSFDVTLKNGPRPQNLGSAELYAPANISVAGASITSGGGGGTASFGTYANAVTVDPNDSTSTGRSVISLRNLTVPAGASVVVHVTATVTGTGTKYWYSIAKQANSFNPGDFDTSNALTFSGVNPTFAVSTCTLQFVNQPANPWQKNTTIAPPVAVAVFAGTTKVAVSATPTLAVAAGSSGGASDFPLGSASYNSSTLSWSWPDAKPNATAPSGSYKLTATLGSMTATSDSDSSAGGNQPFQVADIACASGATCTGFSNLQQNDQTIAGVTFKNTLTTAVIVNFVAGGGPQTCAPWNPTFIPDASGNPLDYFPAVSLNVTRATGDTSTLQVTYLIRNSDWVLTNTNRGNQDIDFCVGARHQTPSKNGDGGNPTPFTTAYGNPARWGCLDPSQDPGPCTEGPAQYWGVIPTVQNPNKVGNDPAICGHGTVYLPDPSNNNTVVAWRTWVHCIPNDWDYYGKGG